MSGVRGKVGIKEGTADELINFPKCLNKGLFRMNTSMKTARALSNIQRCEVVLNNEVLCSTLLYLYGK